jgi:hypothetical protein
LYASCLYCHSSLGHNESVEHFPVGRRLAFDSANGRFWVICPSCRRWNLSPLEERWDAIDECERLFERTRLRMSTDNIGLARIAEGTELVRVGTAMRPEMAAWRFGAQLAARRRKYMATVAGGVLVAGGLYIGVKSLGFGFIAGNWAWKGVKNSYERVTRLSLPAPDSAPRRLLTLPSDPNCATVRIESRHAQGAKLIYLPLEERLQLAFPTVEKRDVQYSGDAVLRIAPKVLARINRSGGKKAEESLAVALLENAVVAGAPSLFEGVLKASALDRGKPVAFEKRSAPLALALEMALHEDRERVALAGELLDLELAWKEAEELARISDSLGSSAIDRALASLKAKMLG